MQKVSQNGTMYQKLLQYMQLALVMARKVDPMAAEQIAQDILMTTGGAGIPASGGATQFAQGSNGTGENAVVKNARARSNQAAQPD